LNNQLIHPLTNNKHQQQNGTNNKENNIEVEQTWRRVERRREGMKNKQFCLFFSRKRAIGMDLLQRK
jgi:hypothetical protein